MKLYFDDNDKLTIISISTTFALANSSIVPASDSIKNLVNYYVTMVDNITLQ